MCQFHEPNGVGMSYITLNLSNSSMNYKERFIVIVF